MATRLVGAADRLGEARTGDDDSDLVPTEGGSDTLPGRHVEHWKWLSGRLTGEVTGDDVAFGVELNTETARTAGADSEDQRRRRRRSRLPTDGVAAWRSGRRLGRGALGGFEPKRRMGARLSTWKRKKGVWRSARRAAGGGGRRSGEVRA
jgi:hypothetical protein